MPTRCTFLGVIATQTGRHDLAVERIRQAVVFNPNNAAAHSNLGEACRAAGRLDEAIASFRCALQLKPDFPEAHNNLGNALNQRGQFDEAVAACRRALQWKPNYPEACNNLGNALREQGKLDEAVAACRRALELKPDFPEAHNNLGSALKEQGRLDKAIAAFRRALELKPDFPEAHNNLGVALAEQGQPDEAVAAYRRTLQLKPDYPEAHMNLGNTLRQRGQLDEAIAAYHRALELKPGYAKAHLNLGIALVERDQLDDAISAFRHALELKPDDPEACNGLGGVLAAQGQIDQAMAAYRQALQLKPDYGSAKFNLSLQLLLRGDFEHGWSLYEARWAASQSIDRNFSQPRWDGSMLDGRRVLIHAEQGFGDPLQPFDVHVPMLSQPLIFQTTLESIPREVPYLFADSVRRETWRRRLGGERPCLRVGLAWTGNLQKILLQKRHIAPNKLLPLLGIAGVDFFSLQMERGAEQIRQLSSAAGIIDYTEHIHDFVDTAAFMAELDLIISVDTSVAHLAGALGRPVWTLLPFVADWRWGLESEETPWYPTMRLFRQPAAGNWDAVIQRVAEELSRVVAVGPRMTNEE